jgi:hypothetical protein
MVWRRLGCASLWLVLCSASASAQLVMAPGGGSDPVVRILDSSGSAASFLAYPAGFRGGVRVALGDVNGGRICEGDARGDAGRNAPGLCRWPRNRSGAGRRGSGWQQRVRQPEGL